MMTKTETDSTSQCHESLCFPFHLKKATAPKSMQVPTKGSTIEPYSLDAGENAKI
jgi:hypothetical protein